VLNVNGECIVARAGYYFKMYLPDVTNAGDIAGIPEDGPDGVGGFVGATFPDSNNTEVIWACYAWPIEPESTGNRAFFINQEGDLIQCLNNTGSAASTAGILYSGVTSIPVANAAIGASALTGMGANLGITAQGLQSNDGNVWTIVGN
jgi:hypothetical protein